MWTDEANRFVAGELADLEPGTALDLACGEGRNALWLASRGWRVTGIDFSQVALDRAASLAAERGITVRFERADLLTWTPSERFDLVVVSYLQLPADQMERVVGAAASSVAPGGRLFVIGHHFDNATDGYGGPPTAEVTYTEADLARWASPLRVVKAERVLRPVDTQEGVRNAIDAMLVATPV
jgi:2-polyprenyl-3-methyl-5-hydroxy-6-metoxy-1,4-benzoquinol methylase